MSGESPSVAVSGAKDCDPIERLESADHAVAGLTEAPSSGWSIDTGGKPARTPPNSVMAPANATRALGTGKAAVPSRAHPAKTERPERPSGYGHSADEYRSAATVGDKTVAATVPVQPAASAATPDPEPQKPAPGADADFAIHSWATPLPDNASGRAPSAGGPAEPAAARSDGADPPASAIAAAAVAAPELRNAVPDVATAAMPISAAKADLATPLHMNARPTATSDTVRDQPGRESPAITQAAPVVVALAMRTGSSSLSIRLAPAELGELHVRIERPGNGAANVSLTADRPETLAMLMRDQTQLHRALDNAGIATDGRQLSFHLAPPPPPTSHFPA
ncbi:MAG TPA: flagellar hook-length control protein FliK, partial [Acetobacteraceae bacterium]|nr:flagellar hook-length control protein FliK [Acetobacteraceae bacterium]